MKSPPEQDTNLLDMILLAEAIGLILAEPGQ